MIQTATKYTKVPSAVQTRGRAFAKATARQARNLAARRSQQVFIPTLTGAAKCLKDWYWREIKEGGFLHEYLASEKRRTPQMIRRVARIMDGFQQNNKSDFKRLAQLPARMYHRWKAEDANFFDDDNNLRSLKRDNPDLPVYVAPRQMPTSRFRKVYREKAEGETPNIERRTSNAEA